MDKPRAATERHLLHFQVPPQSAGDQILTFQAGLADYRVHAHTQATRADARVGNPLLQLLPDTHFSHYLEVDLPADAVMMTALTRRIEVNATPAENFLSLAVHVPRETRRSPALQAGRAPRAPHPKLQWLQEEENLALTGAALARLSAADLEADWLHDFIDPFETASALLAQHPSLINLNAESGAPAIILRDCIGRALRFRSRLMREIRRLGADWSRCVPLLEDGMPVVDDQGPVFTAELHDDLPEHITQPLSLAIRYATQAEELREHTWRLHYGSTTEERDAVQAAQVSIARPAAETRWRLQAMRRMNGLRTERGVVFQPSREGGWTIDENWSSEDTPAMDADIVAALSEGRLFARVDAAGRPGAWTGVFPAQTLRDDAPARFEARHESDTAGADYAAVSLALDDLRMDLGVHLELTAENSDAMLEAVNLGVRERDGSERLVWRARPSTRGLWGNLRVTVVNEWLRHLSAYVEFYDAAGQVITPQGWEPRLPAGIRDLFDTHATKRYIGMLPPIGVVFGIPLPAQRTRLDIPVPESAASVQLYWGGLGTGRYDATVCPAGITATTVICMAFPTLMLMLGSRMDAMTNAVLQDPTTRDRLLAVGAGLIGNYIALSQSPGRAAAQVALALGPALAKAGLKKLSIHLARRAGEGAARRAIPFINIAFKVMDTAITLAQLGQTTAAVLQSPFYYRTRFTRSFDLHVTIKPDPQYNQFPRHRDLLRVQVLYDTGNSLPLSEGPPPAPLPREIPVRFDDIPAGGRLRVLVFFYAANGWQSASGSTEWVDARGSSGSTRLDLEVVLKNELVALSADSVYQHEHVLAREGGRYAWQRRPAPTQTVASRGPLQSLVGITAAQRPAMLGYAWQIDDPRSPGNTLYLMQNISVMDDPELRRAVTAAGFAAKCGISYDVGSPDDGSGANFYLDPSRGNFDPDANLAGGIHLRRIALSSAATPRFETGSGQSWGRFPDVIDSFAVHPQGYVAGVNTTSSKLYVLELPEQPGADADARMASLYGGDSDDGSDDFASARAGLMFQPRAIAVALDGRLLVLENGNRRIQSFDLSGNPVPYFRQPGSEEKTPLLPLRDTDAATTTYLDLSVEARGYLFVLAQDESGVRPEHYRVDIYEPDGTFLVSTPRVAAEKIAVDLARSLYTLNWESLHGPEGRPEPSVSLWLAPPPEDAQP